MQKSEQGGEEARLHLLLPVPNFHPPLLLPVPARNSNAFTGAREEREEGKKEMCCDYLQQRKQVRPAEKSYTRYDQSVFETCLLFSWCWEPSQSFLGFLCLLFGIGTCPRKSPVAAPPSCSPFTGDCPRVRGRETERESAKERGWGSKPRRGRGFAMERERKVEGQRR